MKIGLILFLIIILGVFIVGVVWGFKALVGQVDFVYQSATPFSPLEDEIVIDNTEICSDSDGGIFFEEKGGVFYKRNFLIVEWVFNVEDRCEDGVLNEYFCTDLGKLGGGTAECENGCIDGACIGDIFLDRGE